ncbi:hypothetical protein SteCoe_33844 [Stentor coeruleus]|uniref:Cyclic nucleotide-binding domain-containing protein n=1 Tax=Stentor coeruleus TaxID=5963 RepID=A0A1R2AVU3_9CILI|nr:hypothetical protein SteCoe_33844 [Stentor coeruleus]
MPEFFIRYIGKIKLDFKIHDFSQDDPETVRKAAKDYAENNIISALNTYFQSFATFTNTEKIFNNFIVCLIRIKDYSSSVILFQKLGIISPILAFNIAFACIYTLQYKLGMYILDNAFQEDSDFVLMKVYLLYLLSNDAKALELYSKYQKLSVKKIKSQAILIPKTRAVSRTGQRKTPLKKISNHQMSINLHKKGSLSMTISTIPIILGITQEMKSTKKDLKPLLKARIKLPKKLSLKGNKKLGLNMDMIHSETLPDLNLPVITFSKPPDLPDVKTPSDSQYFTLTKKAIEKLIKSLSGEKDLELAYKIVKRLKFFQQYTEKVCLMLLDVSEYIYFQQGQIIFREGDFADGIYVILEGSVSVQQEYKGMSFVVNSRYDGETIGEYAIARGSVDINEAKRSATCIAGEKTHMLKIISEKYAEVMNSQNDNESELLKFLKKIVFFEHIPPVDLAYLANTLHPQKYFFEHEVLGFGEIPKGLYIIMQGRLKAIYKKKEIELPPKYFFGQKILVGETEKSKCRVISNAVESLVLILQPNHFDLIYRPLREIALAKLAKHIDYDL